MGQIKMKIGKEVYTQVGDLEGCTENIEGVVYFSEKDNKGNITYTELTKENGFIVIKGWVYQKAAPGKIGKMVELMGEDAKKVGKFILYGSQKDNPKKPRRRQPPEKRMKEVRDPFQNSQKVKEPGAFREPKFKSFADPGW